MFKKVLQISLLLTLIVIVLGAYTRLEDAGLGCPDWPGCYGSLTVPDVVMEGYERPLDTSKAWKEMTHRYAASALGFFVVIIFVLAFIGKTIKKQSAKLPAFLLLIVILQGALGMWTVTELVHPGIVSLHLIGGFITASIITWLLLNQGNAAIFYEQTLKRHKALIAFVIILVFMQIILGGWTSTNYAALSCGNQFPQCLGQWYVDINFSEIFYWGELGVDYEYGILAEPVRSGINMLHRIGALIATIALIGLIFTLKHYRNLRANLLLTAILLITQIILGILNVVLSLPITIAILHNLVALLLLLSLVSLAHKVFNKRIRDNNLSSVNLTPPLR